MSGHSKWAQIKRKKALTDAKKGRLFSKLSKLIEISAQKGGDVKSNFSLKAIVDQAKAVNMPAVNIDKAIKKGSSSGNETSGLEEVIYEAYGPGGSAILIKGITDNRSRTVAEIKHILAKNNGHLAELGSVKWLFEEKGVIRLATNNDLGQVEELAILNNAEDIRPSEDGFEVIVLVGDFEKLKKVFQNHNFETEDSAIEWLAKNKIILDEAKNIELARLVEALDEDDDVSEVFTNTD